MITRSLRRAHASSVTTEELPITGKQVAVRPVQQFMRLVYRKLPDDLSCEEGDARRLHEEIRQAILDYGDILRAYPAVVYLSDVRLAQVTRFGFTAYFISQSGQTFRAIPFRSGNIPDGVIVCASA